MSVFFLSFSLSHTHTSLSCDTRSTDESGVLDTPRPGRDRRTSSLTLLSLSAVSASLSHQGSTAKSTVATELPYIRQRVQVQMKRLLSEGSRTMRKNRPYQGAQVLKRLLARGAGADDQYPGLCDSGAFGIAACDGLLWCCRHRLLRGGRTRFGREKSPRTFM